MTSIGSISTAGTITTSISIISSISSGFVRKISWSTLCFVMFCFWTRRKTLERYCRSLSVVYHQSIAYLYSELFQAYKHMIQTYFEHWQWSIADFVGEGIKIKNQSIQSEIIIMRGNQVKGVVWIIWRKKHIAWWTVNKQNKKEN